MFAALAMVACKDKTVDPLITLDKTAITVKNL